jgi:hypothetical protein
MFIARLRRGSAARDRVTLGLKYLPGNAARRIERQQF